MLAHGLDDGVDLLLCFGRAERRATGALGLRHMANALVHVQERQVGAVEALQHRLDLLVEPALHLVDPVDARAAKQLVVGVVVEVIEDVGVVALFVIAEFVADLAVDVVVREVVAAAGDQRVASHAVVAGLADVQPRVVLRVGNDDVDGEAAFEAFSMQSEDVGHGMK
ncbi:hypothetical protein D3C85_1439540 [compost metagenome]